MYRAQCALCNVRINFVLWEVGDDYNMMMYMYMCLSRCKPLPFPLSPPPQNVTHKFLLLIFFIGLLLMRTQHASALLVWWGHLTTSMLGT